MAIIRSKIARQLLAEGGVSLDDAKMMAPEGEFLAYINPKEAGILRSMGGSGKMTPMGIPSFTEDDEDQLAMDAPDYSALDNEEQQAVDRGDPGAIMSTISRDLQGFGPRTNLSDLDSPSFFENLGTGISNLVGQGKRGDLIFNYLGRATAPTMRGRLGLGRRGDINYILEVLQANKGDPVAIGLTPKQFEIGEKLISAGIKDETDIRNMTQSQFDSLFPGPQTGGGGDGDNEPIKKLRAPITEDKKEESKSEFDDILKFYGAKYARGGDVDYAALDNEEQQAVDRGESTMMTTEERDAQGYGPGDNLDDMPTLGPPTTMGGGGGRGPLGVPTFQNLQTHFANNAKLAEAVRMGLITNEEYNVLGGYDVNQTMGLNPALTGLGSLAYNVVQSVKGGQPFSEIAGDVGRNVQGSMGLSPDLQAKYESIVGPGSSAMMASLQPFGGPRFEDGGEVRQEYGLGSIVKKATRAVKKIAKSPLGKAALFYAGTFGIPGTSFKGLSGLDAFKNLSTLQKAMLVGGTALTLSPFATEEEDEKLPTVANTDPEIARTLEFYGGPRRFAAEGGMMEQDEMLDLGGNEMDLRGGGFVPLGEYEKKDDVPARLSKNEFVFTADAVRAAGGGSVDKGADVMYKTMKTLENKVA
jgi:hypothetical protein